MDFQDAPEDLASNVVATTDASGHYQLQWGNNFDVVGFIDLAVGYSGNLAAVNGVGQPAQPGAGCDVPLIPTPNDPAANDKYQAAGTSTNVNWTTDGYCLPDTDVESQWANDESTAAGAGASNWQAVKAFLSSGGGG